MIKVIDDNVAKYFTTYFVVYNRGYYVRVEGGIKMECLEQYKNS